MTPTGPNPSFNSDAASTSHCHHRNAPHRQRRLTPYVRRTNRFPGFKLRNQRAKVHQHPFGPTNNRSKRLVIITGRNCYPGSPSNALISWFFDSPIFRSFQFKYFRCCTYHRFATPNQSFNPDAASSRHRPLNRAAFGSAG